MSATRNPQQQPHEPRTNDAAETTVDNDRETVETVIIHSDGSYHQEEDLSAAGFTLETNGGDVIKERWQEAPNADTSMETEAAAALAAVREAKEFSPSYIILYSDCKPLVDRLDQDYADHQTDSIYKHIRAELHTVEFTSISHVPRDRNRRADELAHRALRELRGEEPTGLA